MKKINVFVHDHRLLDYILIDGKNLLFTKDKDRRMYVASMTVNRDDVTIASDTYHPYLQDGWWIKNMVIFIISFFGVFAPRYMPRTIYHFVGQIHLEKLETNIEIKWGWTDTAFTIEGASVTIEHNEKVVDPRIRKRKKLLGWSKFLFILMVLGVAVLIMMAIN